jgi:hypothetical protein
MPTNSTVPTVGCSLREDLLWLNDVYSGMAEDPLVDSPPGSDYSKATRLLSCPQERADGIYFWQCFEEPCLTQSFGGFSKTYCQDMLNQYVPEHCDGRTPLQLSAVNFGYSLAYEQSETIQSLETMISCIIESGADLHEADHCHTPFILFLAYFASARRFWDKKAAETRPRDLRRAVVAWLSILQRAGVDLVAYGAQESCVVQAFRSMNQPLPQLQRWFETSFSQFSDEVFYFTFSYGQTPEFWTVQLDIVEDYASDFWQMPGLLEATQVHAIPGSWIDT